MHIVRMQANAGLVKIYVKSVKRSPAGAPFDALGLASGQSCGFPVHRQVTDPDQKRSSRVMQVSTTVRRSSIVCKSDQLIDLHPCTVGDGCAVDFAGEHLLIQSPAMA